MISLSLCMIVKNEENTLSSCLESVKNVVDEIIIIDTGSTDQTVEIAKKYTRQIYQFNWIDDFSAARNFAFQHAKMDYILTMDADDIFTEEDKDKLIQLKSTLSPSVDAITLKYLAGFDPSGNVLVSLRQVRIVKREKQFQWRGAVHEYLEISGNIYHSDISVIHKRSHRNSDRNLQIYEKQLKSGYSFTPRDLFYYANELYDHGKYQNAIHYYLEFLQTENHWNEDELAAYGRISDCFSQLSDFEHGIQYALKSFGFGPPRSENCCRLGFLFLQLEQPQTASYWFQFATLLPEIDTGGVINHACSTWIPHLQLSVCSSQLGNYKKAYTHIEIARSFCPRHELILKNKSLLEKLMKK